MKLPTILYNKDHGPLPALLLGLTAVTGVVDAISILSLGRVFVANMTGNIVFIGLAIAHAPGFSLASSLFALAGFLIGAVIVGRLIDKYSVDRGKLFAAACISEFVFISGALIIGLSLNNPTIGAGRYSLSILLAIMMGIQNAAVRKIAVPDMTTTVLTMTLTDIAADVRRSGWHSAQLLRRIVTVLAMLIGALIGAELVLNRSATSAIALVEVIVVVIMIGALISVQKPGKWRVGG
ncbi:MAG TPA: YoaK family protein [Candidatus Saccharimonadales bacterium]